MEPVSQPGDRPDRDALRVDRDAPRDPRMTVLEHLQELRKRLRNAGLVFAATTLASSFFTMHLFDLLSRPVVSALRQLGQEPVLIKLTPSEGFWVQVKLALVLGIATALPLACWELWKFIAPGLYRRERRLVAFMTAATVGCFAGGAIFGYTLLSRTTHLFLLGTGMQVPGDGGAVIRNMLSMSGVADFQITLLLGCGVAFELPVVLGLLGWLGLIGARGMWRFNKYALVLAAVAGALLTPGADVYAQLLLAGPLYVLYNLSIGVVWLIERRGRPASHLDTPLMLLIASWPALRRRRWPRGSSPATS
jgi:sec-independent protein translocase protein TatC